MKLNKTYEISTADRISPAATAHIADNHQTGGSTARQSAWCYTATAMELLGLPRRAFRKLGLKPARIVKNPYCSSQQAYLYDRTVVLSLVGSPSVRALQPKPRTPVDYAGRFIRRYGQPDKALPDAAEAMWNLNRYAKHRCCRPSNRSEIYELKNDLVRLLYARGFCADAYRHVKRLPARECWRCDGSGAGWDGDPCPRCNGTGVYGTSCDRVSIVFRFEIDGHRYTWHQPEKLVNFTFTLTKADAPMCDVEVKPLEIPRGQLARCKALVRWVTTALSARTTAEEQSDEDQQNVEAP